MDSRVLLAFLYCLFLGRAATTTIEPNVTTDAKESLNSNVSPGLIIKGTTENIGNKDANTSDHRNTTLKTLVANNVTSTTQTTLFTSAARRTSSLNIQVGVSKRQSSKSTQVVIVTPSESSLNSSIAKTKNLTTSKLSLHTIDTLNSTNVTKASPSTTTDTILSRQTPSVDLKSTKALSVSQSLSTEPHLNTTHTTETAQNSTSKYTTNRRSTSSKQKHLSNNTTTVRNRLTTDPFSDNRPWNLRRSTRHPIGNGRRRTTTEPISDNYDKGDTFWPVAMALTIGIPTIIVFAVTITVLYRRRMNKPRGLLGIYGTDYQSL